jgi:ribonuclease J
MLRLAQPHYFMPAHGEYRMLKIHGQIALQVGLPKDHIFICDNGDMLQLKNHVVTRTSNHVPAEDVYIDGNDLDGLSSSVINDREQLKNDGMVAVLLTIDSKRNKVIVPASVYSRGFNAGKDTHVIRHAQIHAQEAIDSLMGGGRVSFAELKSTIRETVSQYIYRRTERNPMIIPIIMDVGERA